MSTITAITRKDGSVPECLYLQQAKPGPLPLLDAGHGRYRIPLCDAGGMEASGDRI